MAIELDDFRLHYADLSKAFPDKKLISKKQFAEYLGMRLGTVYKWDLPTIKVGKRNMIPVISAAKWLSCGKKQ